MTPEEAYKLMTEKGLSFAERMMIYKTFAQEGKNKSEVREVDGYFKHEDLPEICFDSKKVAEFAGALVKLRPDISTEALMSILSILLKLLDIESDATFTIQSNN